ncbi:hypothetical protein Acr_24g0016230 [Actinidia rufa]|uniref:Uncharacterized protein n=1 Tax=Actinidia rufa TaxID=165716 RepID=A0A7J0GXB4_9ERIC|nr:hypothetical protein Acr_24g0016230 [Actinidia rufa]
MVIYEEGEREWRVRRKERWLASPPTGTGTAFELTCYQTHPVKATHFVRLCAECHGDALVSLFLQVSPKVSEMGFELNVMGCEEEEESGDVNQVLAASKTRSIFAFRLHVKKLAAPFRQSEIERADFSVPTREEDIGSWALFNSFILIVSHMASKLRKSWIQVS